MYPGKPVSSSLNTDIESSGISATLRVSSLIELWAKATKGTAKKARTINAKILGHHIFFLLLINMLEPPPRDPFYRIAHLNTAECCATVVPAEKLESWAGILEQIHNPTVVAPREGTKVGLERRVQTDTGGV